MYLTCDNSGRFYTTESVWGDQPKHYLARMTFSHGRFSRPERLTIQPHYENQTHPCIAPDGKYLFFSVGDDIWWVDIRVIENLRPISMRAI